MRGHIYQFAIRSKDEPRGHGDWTEQPEKEQYAASAQPAISGVVDRPRNDGRISSQDCYHQPKSERY
jgi:hypothetical protein